MRKYRQLTEEDRIEIYAMKQAGISGAADKAAIQRVKVPPCQLSDSGT